jgi:hemerythrin-like domain-containing protein
MAVQIGARPDSGFDDPIGMLKDCHRRIERFLDILRQVIEQAKGQALTADERVAAEAALRYFRESGPRHNLDEEDSLFPRLRKLEAGEAVANVDRLASDHGKAGALHAETDLLYSKWISDGELKTADAERLQAITARLVELYRAHIRLEEEIVFPRAAKLLDQEAVAAMGAEFRTRRS